MIISEMWNTLLSQKDACSLKEIQKTRILVKDNCLKGLNDSKGAPLSGVEKMNYGDLVKLM